MTQSSQRPILAVDLGGTKIIAALILPAGEVMSRNYCLTLAGEGPKAVIHRVLSAIEGVLAKAKLEICELGGIGIAAAGILDTGEGVVTTSPNLPGWDNVPLKKLLVDKLGIDIYIINDASAAALGEHRFGAGKGVNNLVFLTVSTGIGGGIIIDGKLYQGANGCAGELGHIVIESNGPKCNCGNLGCLEALASGTAMAREAVRRLVQGETSCMRELVEGRLENVTAEVVASAARQGDLLACEVVSSIANYLGIGLANLVNIFNPELIIIGGGVSKMGDMLLEPARKVVEESALSLPSKTVRIVQARLGDDAGVVGAAAYVNERQLVRNTMT